MKNILVVCGTGIATSTIVIAKLKEWLTKTDLSYKVQLHQAEIGKAVNRFEEYDIVISTTLVPDSMKDKVIDGVPLLSGFGSEAVCRQLEEEIKR
ncbi:PTS sugar transporter subunit IIB [Virgibacillus necropolis]|uniref:PTS sugar transporter subunit IIB n=1 Tax=Virgibacillus necropolis TaxID=163877 RepID=UPI00384B2F2E